MRGKSLLDESGELVLDVEERLDEEGGDDEDAERESTSIMEL
jgi:hypothetical protein